MCQKNPSSHGVSRGFHRNDVSRLDQHLGDELKSLLRSVGHDHVVHCAAHTAAEAYIACNGIPQRTISLCLNVGLCELRRRSGTLLQNAPPETPWKVREIRHAHSEIERHLRPRKCWKVGQLLPLWCNRERIYRTSQSAPSDPEVLNIGARSEPGADSQVRVWTAGVPLAADAPQELRIESGRRSAA
jgi:hypothetical protein